MVLVSKISLKEITMTLESTIRKMYLPEEDIDKEMQVILEETDFDEIIESIMAEEVELEEKWRVTNKDLGVWTGEAKSEKDAKEKAMRKWGVRKSQASSPMFMKNTEAVKEEVEIDEGKQKPYVSSDKDGAHVMNASGEIVKSFKDMDSANAYLKKNYNKLKKEEVEVDESTKEYGKSLAKIADKAKKDNITKKDLETLAKLATLMKKEEDVELDEDGEDRMKKRNKAHALDKKRDHEFAMKWGKKKEEDVELDEGRMKELHGYIEKGMSAEDIAKKMKLDVKTIKSLMNGKIVEAQVKKEDEDEKETDKKAKKDDAKKTGKEKIEINPTVSEARRSAAQQARRDAGSTFKDKDDEEDDVATDADKKRADLNIIMQLKKAADNPRHKVKFDDGKAVVIKPAVVKGILQTFAKLKSNDKQKIQPEMAKSYKSMVAVMGKLIRKAGYNENIEESQMDKVTMERMGISPDLVSAVKDVLTGKRPVEEKSGDAEAYKKFFDSALKKFKVGSPSELDDDQKKKFYDYIDKNWTSDAEKAGKDEAVQKEETEIDEHKGTKPHDHPHDDEVDEGSISKAAKKAFVKKVSGESVDEKEMTDAQMEKREEIVKELKKKTEDFKKKYGDRWEDVMYATATKLAMK